MAQLKSAAKLRKRVGNKPFHVRIAPDILARIEAYRTMETARVRPVRPMSIPETLLKLAIAELDRLKI